MTNKCQCDSCITSELHKKQSDLSDKTKSFKFKEIINTISSLSDGFKVNKPSSSNSLVPIVPNTKQFRIILGEYDPSNGYAIELTKNLKEYEYFLLIEEFFGSETAIEDEETSSDSGVMHFNTFEEVIEFLEKRQNEENNGME